MAAIEHVDEARLEEDLEYRYEFLAGFIGFGAEDVARIHQSAMHIFPYLDEIVEATYTKLLAYDATARHFVVRGTGFEGDVADALADLSTQQDQIQFRKEHLKSYFTHILGRAYDGAMVKYLNSIAKMHTPKGGSSKINVPAVQMNAFMGMLSELLSERIMALDMDREEAFRTIRAYHKLLWIQNDLINRQYQI